MSKQASGRNVITFDSFTTLVDALGAMERALEPYTDDPDPVVACWRSRAVAYRMMCNFTEEYGTYLETTRDALTYALELHDVELSRSDVDNAIAEFHELRIFDDVTPCMAQLYSDGYELYIASNGTSDLLESIVSRADVDEYVTDTISANEIRTYKPSVAFYEHVSERTGAPLDHITHVATPWYDVSGAMNAGMDGVWVNRRGNPWETFGSAPDSTVSDLAELVSELSVP